MSRIDYTAASTAIEPNRVPVIDNEPDPEPTTTRDADGLNLYAFAHCPECGYIYHRASGCSICHPVTGTQGQ